MHFTKDSFVSGDAFYYTSDGKTVCLPLGTITVQESKAPAGYQLNPTVFVQKITGDGKPVSYTHLIRIRFRLPITPRRVCFYLEKTGYRLSLIHI